MLRVLRPSKGGQSFTIRNCFMWSGVNYPAVLDYDELRTLVYNLQVSSDSIGHGSIFQQVQVQYGQLTFRLFVIFFESLLCRGASRATRAVLKYGNRLFVWTFNDLSSRAIICNSLAITWDALLSFCYAPHLSYEFEAKLRTQSSMVGAEGHVDFPSWPWLNDWS